MVDFSRAEGSKNHRASFVKASNNVIELIQSLQSSYETKWVQLEQLRKDRAAIIEATIQLLKNNKLKLNKQLGRCKNPEINEELLKIINNLPFQTKEEIQYNLLKINNRYQEIVRLGKELETLEEMLSNYRIEEDDYEEEVEIDLGRSKNPKNPISKNIIPVKSEITTHSKIDLSKVIDIHDASEELIQDLTKTLDTMKKPVEEVPTSTNVKSSLIADEDITHKVNEFDYEDDMLASIQDEVDAASLALSKKSNVDVSNNTYDDVVDSYNSVSETDKINDYLDYASDHNIDEPSGECILFTITEKLTLKEIAKNVYGEEKYWKDLYNYGTNRGKLDRKASEYRVPVETIASLAGYLDNVTLKFPTELVTIEEIPQEEYNRRVA